MTNAGINSNINYYDSLIALKKKELEQLEQSKKLQLEKLALKK